MDCAKKVSGTLGSVPDTNSPDTISIDALDLGEQILVDGLGLPAADALSLLSACGLGEAQLLLRTPRELSDGQRYRYRLAKAFALRPRWIVADEFTAALDRTLAKVIAFNLRKLASRTGIGCLLATTHADILEDLQPDLHIACRLDGAIDVSRSLPRDRDTDANRPHIEKVSRTFGSVPDTPIVKKKDISFAHELWLSRGSRADWPFFARWHYRSHHLGIVRHVTLLWHGEEPIGICVFTSPAMSLAARSQYFGLSGRWSRRNVATLNRQLVTLSRVVLHPTYRGAGIAAAFVRASCKSCPWPWIESLTEMGRLNPFFERAGFQRVKFQRVNVSRDKVSRTLPSVRDTGAIPHPVSRSPRSDRDTKGSRAKYSALYGDAKRRRRLVSRETYEKSRHAEPVYFIFDNRSRVPVTSE